jgi:glycosyltransferase involved in cell wall biosynthesis
LKLNLTAPINDTSYGLVSCNLLKELIKLGIEVSLFPIHQINIDSSSEFVPYVQQALRTPYDKNADSLRIWHQFDLAGHVGHGRHIGFPIFELDKFNAVELHHLRSQDHLIVTCQWAKDIIAQNDITVPTSVVNLGVNTEIFYPSSNPPSDKFIILNAGKWEVRKGHDILPDIIRRAFHPTDDYELWMLSHNFFCSAEEVAQWQSKYDGLNVKFFPRFHSQEEVASIMRQATVGIFPSRAEGWNLELLEMMGCGKPVIATNYSAHTEFCNTANSYLFSNYSSTVPAHDNKWFFGQGNWLNIEERDIEVASNHIQHLYSRYLTGERLCNSNGVATATKFSWTESARQLVEIIL